MTESQLEQLVLRFSVRPSGAALIDVTERGLDESHGITKQGGINSSTMDGMLVIGDARYAGGNDKPPRRPACQASR